MRTGGFSSCLSVVFPELVSQVFFVSRTLLVEGIFFAISKVDRFLNLGQTLTLLLHFQSHQCFFLTDVAVDAVVGGETIKQTVVLIGEVAAAIAKQFGANFWTLFCRCITGFCFAEIFARIKDGFERFLTTGGRS